MKRHLIQSFVYNAIAVLSLWTSGGAAQQHEQPRIALKLSAEAQQKQQTDPNFISTLFQKAGPQAFASSGAPPVSVGPLISTKRSAALVSTARLGPEINFDAWYQVQVGSQSQSRAQADDVTTTQNRTGTQEPKLALPKDVLDLIHGLQKLPEVEGVQALYPGPPPAVNPADDPRSTNQGYLNAAPAGIDARYAWGFTGGDGAGVNVVDMEQGWNLNHEDLAAAGITIISGRNAAWFGHGTSVMGEMLMVDNQLGGVGIIPAAKGRVISQHRDDFSYNTPAAILDAAANMNFGDILLLEAQEYDPVSGVYYWPVEIADASYEAIRVATALGITVVQAGCNGGYDLDAYTNLAGKHIFDRSNPDFRDSGSVMVGGANSAVPHTRWYGSNYGSRMDVYAWAESVDTADTDEATGSENLYTSWFGGTSGASPIIVGAAAIVQGISSATRGFKLAPLEIRTILATNGTASNDPPTDRIGVMPDLKAIIDREFNPGGGNHTVDLYIRDNVNDSGATTSGAVSSSPDIIVRQHPIPNPSTALGTGSGTENSLSLSDPVLSGSSHSVYIRVLNRGTGPASNAAVTVFWSEPATLVTPNMWHEIGTLAIPSVPHTPQNLLTVSPELNWPAASVPGTGHYCFVALAGAAGDPTPLLPQTFPDFVKFVRENNNVAWRNFNVISAPPNGTEAQSPPAGWHKFVVHIPGAWDDAREFTVRAVGSLPKGSSVRLSLPRELADALGIKKGCKPRGNGNGNGGGEKEVVVPIQAAGTVQIGKGILAKGSMARAELQVKVLEEVYKGEGDYEFALVQEWEGFEVGRVTWKFGPVADL